MGKIETIEQRAAREREIQTRRLVMETMFTRIEKSAATIRRLLAEIKQLEAK